MKETKNEKKYVENPYMSQAECYRRLLRNITPLPHQLIEGLDYHKIKSKKHRLPRKEKKQRAKRICLLLFGKKLSRKLYRNVPNAKYVKSLWGTSPKLSSFHTFLQNQRFPSLDSGGATFGFAASDATVNGTKEIVVRESFKPKGNLRLD